MEGNLTLNQVRKLIRQLGGDDAVKRLINESDVHLETPSSDSLNLPKKYEEIEQDFIQRALIRTGGNRIHAAELLGISPRNLQFKINHYKIDTSSFSHR